MVLKVTIFCHTGEGSVSRTEQKSSRQHERQQVRCAFKMRSQRKDGRAQYSQEWEEEHANYRREQSQNYTYFQNSDGSETFYQILEFKRTAVSQFVNEEPSHDHHHSVPKERKWSSV